VGDTELSVPPEVYVSINVYGVHSDPQWWGDDALEWKPRRWIKVDPKTGKETISPPPPGATFVPWSVGPR
jgi:cytochrome P450